MCTTMKLEFQGFTFVSRLGMTVAVCIADLMATGIQRVAVWAGHL